MKLILDRDDTGYLIRTEEELVSKLVGSSFRHALARAEQLARGKRANLFVTKSCLADWYVGVPKEGKPEIFYDTKIIFSSELPEKYRYVEGPFEDSETATKACFKLTGKIGSLITT